MRNALLALLLLAAAAPVRAWDRLDGQRSGIRSFRTEAVRDAASWQALWTEHMPGQPVPEVDFSREQVAAVFLGPVNTAGVSISVELQNDPLDPSRLVVFYAPRSQRAPGFAAQVITYPYVLVKTRRASATAFEAEGRVSIPEGSGRAPANDADGRRVSIPDGPGLAPANPEDGRRVRIQPFSLERWSAPSFDGR